MAEGLEGGVVWLSVMAEGSKLQKTTDAAVKKVRAPEILAKIDAELSGLQAKRVQAEKILDGLRQKVTAQADLDIKVLEARKAVAEGKLAELSKQKATPQAELQTARLNADLGRINNQLTALNARRASPEVDAKVAKATSDLAGIDRQITKLNGQRASVQIGADGAAKAAAEIDAVQGKANRLNGSRASINIAAAGGVQASGMLGAIVAGLAAVAAATPAAVAGLAAVAGTASAIGQAGGAGAAGFSGIGDAIKAVEADEKSAATTSAGAASSRKSSANQIASAQSAMAAAVMAADRAAITGADQVADAERSVARAQQQADRTRITSGQQVAAARRAVADAVVAAGERTQAAERAVSRAQDSARWAQESLTRARKAAVEANEDLQLSLSGIAISEKRAELALRKALAARASGGDVDPEMFKGEELDLDVAEASQNLKEVRERYGDLRDEQSQWARGGVDGSDQVIAAQRSLRDANLGVEDSVRSLSQTQRDGARSVQDASAQAAIAQQQAGWAIQDAQAGVADAATASARAARDAGWAQQDAARGVADAQRGLQEALAATAESAGGAGSAGKKSAYELAQLTPAGRSFVAFYTGEWKPAIQGVTDSVASEMLPRIERAMRQSIGLQDVFQQGLSRTGAVLGDVAVKGSDLATSPAFRASFAQIMDSNNRSLGSYGNALVSSADSMRVVTVAGLPLTERLARMAEGGAQAAESFLLQKESTGELGRAMEYGADKAGQLVEVALSLAEAAYKVGAAIAPVGEVVLDLVSGFAQGAGEFAQAHQGLVQFIAVAGLAVTTTNMLAKSIVAVNSSAAIAGGGLKTLWSIISTGLNPAALYNTQIMTRVRDVAEKGGAAASTFGQGLTGVRSSAETATKVTTGFAKAATGLGASLPLVGLALTGIAIANDAVNTSFDEGVEKWGKGGKAAADFYAELKANDAAAQNFDGVGNWIRGSIFGIQTSESFRKELAEQRASWSELQKAQYDAGIAQGNYEEAVRRYGASSPAAITTLQQLKDATKNVEIAQIAVREKTDLATAAMLWQRDQILASLDADLRLRMSKQQLAKDQQAVADAIKNSGAGSNEANAAQLQLEQTQLRTAEAAKASAGGQRAYVDAVREMVANTKGELTPTLAGMVQSLDGAGLAAIGAKVHIDETGHAIATLPNGQTITLDANTSPALTGLAGVQYQLGLVPPGKSITVSTLDQVAQDKLRALGFTVNQIPGTKDVTVTANDAQARNTLVAFQMFAAWQQANPQLAANPQIAYQKMNEFLGAAGQQTGVPALDADPAKADATVRAKLGEFNTWNAAPSVGANTGQADEDMRTWWTKTVDWLANAPFNIAFNIVSGITGADVGYKADGGLVEGYAAGGRIQHKQVFTGYPTGGKVRGPGSGTSDDVPIMASNGEYVVRAAAVRSLGVPTLDALNGMAAGGLVGYAAGGGVKPQPGAPAAAGAGAAPATAPAAVPVPTGDPAAAGAAAAATAGLAGAMGAATGAAGVLQPALAAVTAQQQAMVASGVAPLAGALTGQLVPAVMAGNLQLGVQAPLAHQALQGAQLATQLSTGLTAQNAAVNNAGIVATTTGMSLAAQAQHAGLRLGQQATQLSTGITASTMAGANLNMQVTTGQMRAVNEGHLAGLRGAQGVTVMSTIGFADAWRDQLGRTQPDSARPIKWVIDFPINSLVGAWNALDGQFQLNKHVEPPRANFAIGGPVRGPGGPTADRIPAMLSAGEHVWTAREVTAAGGHDGVEQLRAATLAGPQDRDERRYWAGGGPVLAAHLADGGQTYQAIYQWVRGRFPDARLSSGYRPGDPGYHGAGQAADIVASAPRMREIDQFVGTTRPNIAELIHTPGPFNIKNGRPHRYSAGIAAGHFDHVHIADGPYRGGLGNGQGGGIFIDVDKVVNDAFAKTYQQIDDVPRFFGTSAQVGRDQGVARAGADAVKAKAMDAISAFAMAMGNGMMGVGPIADQVRQAARPHGWDQGAQWAALNWIISRESGWNPTAQNPTSTAFGLFQFLDATWGTVGGTKTDNPLQQATLGMRYIKNRYVDPIGAQRFWAAHGSYHDGGRIPGAREGYAFVQGGERVLTERQNVGFERMVEGADRFPSGPVETRSYDTLTRLVGRDGTSLDLGDYEPRGEVHNHFLENGVIREEVDLDQMLRRADFLAGTSQL